MTEKIIDGIKYRLNEETKTAEVIKKKDGYEGDIIIPATVVFDEYTYRVTGIGKEAFHECDSLTSVVIPNGVTSIEEGAFADCNSWRVIRYGGTVKQCERRFRYWDQCFHSEIVYCTDGDTQIHW